jgi:uncharacterized RDD family membrane protein YckC
MPGDWSLVEVTGMSFSDRPWINPVSVPKAPPAPAVKVVGQKAPPAPAVKVVGQPDVDYAGFWSRLGALLIDLSLILVVTFALAFAVRTLFGIESAAGGEDMENGYFLWRGIVIVMGLCVSTVYLAGLESAPGQATLGKFVMEIKVTDLEGRRISFARAFGRNIVKIITILFCGPLLLLVMSSFSEKKQSIHDALAGTLVVKTS